MLAALNTANYVLAAVNAAAVRVITFCEGVTVPNLADTVTEDMLIGVFDQVLGLLPITLPVSVAFIGFRKGLSFLFQTLRMA